MCKLIIDTYMYFLENARYCVKMSIYVITYVICVSSRARGRQEHHEYQIHRAGDTVNITVPRGLLLKLLPQRAILQIQIRAVPSTRPDSARPWSRPNSGRSLRPTFRPNSGRARPISSQTVWSSVGEIPTRLDLEEEEEI